jgi:site-specific DNA-methyltransferase (adenine-specific)
MARKPLDGTVAENVLKHGTGAINVDGCRISADGEDFSNVKGRPLMKINNRRTDDESLNGAAQQEALRKLQHLGRWPANLIHDGSEEVVGLFPQTTSGTIASHHQRHTAGGNGNTHGAMAGMLGASFGDSGSAARFFYCAKTSKKDRNEGCEHLPEHQEGLQLPRGKCPDCGTWKNAGEDRCKCGGVWELKSNPPPKANNNHPTVKPTALMRYLCRLVTPPSGIVLDPFMGSGSTGKAAVLEGFNFIGIEREVEYLEIAKARIEAAQSKADSQLI